MLKNSRQTSSTQQLPRNAGSSGSRQTRAESSGAGGNNKAVIALAVSGVLLAGAAVFLLTRPPQKKFNAPVVTPSTTAPGVKQTPPNTANPPPVIPSTTDAKPPDTKPPDTKPADAKPPAPPVDIMAGVREESARRALDALIAEEKAAKISAGALRKRYVKYLSGSYKGTPAAKEAQERLDALPPVSSGAAETPPAPTVPGLELKVCEGKSNLTGLVDSDFKIQQKKVAPNIDAGNNGALQQLADRQSDVALIFSGYIEIPRDGKYTFTSTSDDGSLIIIDDELLVDNDGDHAMQSVSDTMDLKMGKHRFRYMYRQGNGDAGLRAEWSGPDLPKQVIPPEAFSHIP